ncbi:lactate 2-monooxygenase [Pontibacter sp. G13]|uniref:lactate 2-monooxygenase n=1 Tax=Pontibacter sp. G13 TaxID=3074898 RepID=UPI00288C1C72|nr:lactate 2-monooxygenase [Pontibacter sp. G13]WNJ20983.1 lactate 2-monooxygenase [Pontibacter sp. G13]
MSTETTSPTSRPAHITRRSLALERQRDIYLSGISGKTPNLPLDLNKLEALAEKKMDREAFAYIRGGAGLGSTMTQNRQDFQSFRIIPRMLRDVSVRDTSTELFGMALDSPLLLSPIGVLEMAHKYGDLAVAQACRETRTPMIISNQASYPMEEICEVLGTSPRWFQLYWSKSNKLVESLVKRAQNCGCSAIVVTLDTTMLGWRMEDLDLGYLPFLRGKGIAQYVSDPIFQKLMDIPPAPDAVEPPRKINFSSIKTLFQQVSNYPGGFWETLKSQRSMKAVKTFINVYSRPSLTWEDLAFLRDITELPILLKGILHPEDAQMAIDYGMDGLLVSNHGGRQVDGSVSAIEMLPELVDAVAGRIPIVMDSGIRCGADVFKALAVGAQGVCLGRPYVYGLALEGAAGVQAVIHNLLSDFELNMGLAGCRNLEEINRDCLKTS